MTPAELEARRIKAEYERRDREIGRDSYSSADATNLFLRQGQQRALRDALARASLLPLRAIRILEVGCGRGRWLSSFEEFGAKPSELAGIDLDESRIAETRLRYPEAELRVGDATKLPWSDESFDIVFQSLVFTSILDGSVRAAVASEMRRVLRRGGVILWYDFTYDNPSNSNVRRVDRDELERLFPSCMLDLKRVTLAPPVARRIVPRSWLISTLLESLRLLNTHYFGVIRPR